MSDHPAYRLGRAQAENKRLREELAAMRENEMSRGEEIIKFFRYDHLPAHLQEVSKPIHDVAHAMLGGGLSGPEAEAGLRKLLEAKDCFVRARLDL